MELSIEGYFAVNFLISAALFTLTARGEGRVRAGAVLLSSLAAAGGATAAQAGRLPRALVPPAVLATVLASQRGQPPRARLKSVGRCALWAGLFAGGMLFLQARVSLRAPGRAVLFALLLFAACLPLAGRRASGEGSGRVRLRIATSMGSTEISAMIDTGNCLREPFSGLPVLVVSAGCLRPVLDPLCLDEARPLPPGFRLVFYRALGGGGRMRCFRPESVSRLCRGRWIEAPDMWVAVYAGRIPGAPDALAPPVLRSGGR